MTSRLFAFAASLAALTGAAEAATYTGSYSISGMTGTPSTFSGTFQVTLDPAAAFIDDIAPDAFASAIGSASFSPSNTRVDYYSGATADQGGKDLLFGAISGTGDTNNSLVSGRTDFRVRFILDSAFNLISARGGYVLGGGITSFDTTTDGSQASFSIAPQASPAPEPATWATLLLGFGMTGAAMRRRRRPVAA